jgi:anti-sigma regulatory factor (Ser/Thr protein kinase)
MKSEITAPLTDFPAVFTQRFSSTRRGARLARRLALYQLHEWGIPYGSDLSDSAGVIVAEFAANAVTHGRVPGRDFGLRLALDPGALWIEVSDARADRLPEPRAVAPEDENGRGLLLVEALAASWGTKERPIGKTLWAELPLPLSHGARILDS